MINSVCKNCGEVFQTKPSRPQEHCSRDCQKKTGYKKRQRICHRCGKRFEVSTSSKEGKYCSLKCSSLAQRIRISYTCEYCGKKFKEQPSERRKYCCHKCATNAQSGKERPNIKGRPSWNKGLTADTSDILARCSEKRRGEKHPRWKGGRVKYYGPDWSMQSKRTRKRDGYKCRHCGVSQKKIGRKLDVHHIQPFKSFGYIRGENDNHKQANDLTNLVTLCPGCHHRAENGRITFQLNLL